jgi:endonuclease-3
MPPESLSKRKIRIADIIIRLKKEYPNSKCSLQFKTPFQLLVATILSSQCTDLRVNKVTRKLFRKYPKARDFSELPLDTIKKAIYSTGFYNNKAKSIKGMAKILLNKHEGEVPKSLKQMVQLPGVGRKTANVVLGNVYNIPSLVVDTHVTRITNLLKFVKTIDAVKIERELMNIIDQNDWTLFAHLLIDHGRAVCIANRPKCEKCIINKLCPSKIGEN